ncbi:MAG: hypothetical protein NTW80_14315 [Deltaproteobacteria bacterium]|nr:hypothetical protein [Deltaproteobacteria bacterium]
MIIFNDKVKIDRELLLEFFLTFSRFEYALKAAGYAFEVRGTVNPDWQTFRLELINIFNMSKNHELIKASNYFFDNPPNKQVLHNGELAWKTQCPNQNESDIEFLLRMVKSVRNNLFHGGKHNNWLHEDKQRTDTLLRNSLIILSECLKLSPQVKNRFDGATI